MLNQYHKTSLSATAAVLTQALAAGPVSEMKTVYLAGTAEMKRARKAQALEYARTSPKFGSARRGWSWQQTKRMPPWYKGSKLAKRRTRKGGNHGAN